MVKTFLCSLVVLAAAAAQPFGAGLKVGVPATDACKIQSVPAAAQLLAEAHRYTIGPYVELRLPLGLDVEADALYRTYDFRNAGIAAPAHSWEFPIVLKHRILGGPIRPYFEGGLSFSHLSDIRAISVNHLSNYGVVAGGGVELRFLPLKMSPEL